jgi:hypothetical protein
MDTRQTWRTFVAVLGALVVFGVLVLGYQAISGPSEDECTEQAFTNAISLDNGTGPVPVDEDC